MKLTTDERRALSFIAALLFASAAVRIAGLPEPVAAPGEGGLDLEAHIEAVEAAVAEKEERERPLEPGETIDPNTATVDELIRLPRVGPALAARIVADREANGWYRSLGDLDRVTGIGAGTLEALAPHLTLEPAAGARDGRPGAAPARAGVAVWSSRSSSIRGSGEAQGDGRVDLNRAGVEELVALPGIGPVLAERIVSFRDSAGPFGTVAELESVNGIGPVTLARLQTLVVVR